MCVQVKLLGKKTKLNGGRFCIDLLIDIHNVQFSHVKRKGNTLAHLLAKHACGIVDFLVWIEENLCFLEQALHHNVISL